MAHDVFISYSEKDKPTADAVCARLENNGIRCWLGPRDVRPGESFAAAIISAIEGSRIVVVIFSSHANTSKFVVREVERAIEKERVIIPFRIESVKPVGEMELFLSTTHWLDALGPDLESHIGELRSVVKSLLGWGSDLPNEPDSRGQGSERITQASATLDPVRADAVRARTKAMMALDRLKETARADGRTNWLDEAELRERTAQAFVDMKAYPEAMNAYNELAAICQTIAQRYLDRTDAIACQESARNVGREVTAACESVKDFVTLTRVRELENRAAVAFGAGDFTAAAALWTHVAEAYHDVMRQAEPFIATRSTALSARQSLEATRDAAATLGAGTVVPEVWSMAEQLAERADAEYATGAFDAAVATWASAGELYEDSRQRAEVSKVKQKARERYKQALGAFNKRRLKRYGGPHWTKVLELTHGEVADALDVDTFVARHDEAIKLLSTADKEAGRAEQRDSWITAKAAAPIKTTFLEALYGAGLMGVVGIVLGAPIGSLVGIVAGLSLRDTPGILEALRFAVWGGLHGAIGGTIGGVSGGLIGGAIDGGRAGFHSVTDEDSAAGLGLWLSLCAGGAGGAYFVISATGVAVAVIIAIGFWVAWHLMRRVV